MSERDKRLLTPMERRVIGQAYVSDPEKMREEIAKAQLEKADSLDSVCPECEGEGVIPVDTPFSSSLPSADCPTCQGKVPKLDRPDKKKIAILMRDIPCSKFRCNFWDVQGHYCFLGAEDTDINCPMANAIIALFPDIEEAKQEVWTRYRSGHLTALSIAVEEAKREERERIIAWGNETCPHDLFGEGTQCFKHACDECWQALRS